MRIGDTVQVVNSKLKNYNKIGKVIKIDDDTIWVALDGEINKHTNSGLYCFLPTSLKILQSTDLKLNDLVRVANKKLSAYNKVGFVKHINNKNGIIMMALKDIDRLYCCRANDLEMLSHEDDLSSRTMRLLHENSSYGKIGEKENNMEGENLIRKHFDNLRNRVREARDMIVYIKEKIWKILH